MNLRPTVTIKYSDFRQSCRAFKPSELLPLIAETSATSAKYYSIEDYIQTLPPWGLAAVARESILSGNELRSKTATLFELRSLIEEFKMVHDSSHRDIEDAWFPVKLLTGHAFEQVPFLHSNFYDICRSYSIFVEGPRRSGTRVINETSMKQLFGGHELKSAISSIFLLYAGALNNKGLFDIKWFSQENFSRIRAIISRECTTDTLNRMTGTIHSIRGDFKRVTGHKYCSERFEYNPLVSTPFVSLGSGPPICPVPDFVLRSATPEGIFYNGIQKYGNEFADDLGILFEAYVGRQLRQIPGATVYPEICVEKKSGREKSVDWFVIFPNLVILVEVKSTRMNREARMGKDETIGNLRRTIDKAKSQISRSLGSVINDIPEYGSIPKDRKFLGLIVTAEPFPLWEGYLESAGGPFVSADETVAGPESQKYPLALATVRDLETLITHGADVNQIIVDLINDKSVSALHIGNIKPSEKAKNSIVEDAWDHILPSFSVDR